MAWKKILKEKKKYNMDGIDHYQVLLDLREDIRKSIEEAHSKMSDIGDNMIKEYGFKNLEKYLMHLDKSLKTELMRAIVGELEDIGTKANEILNETFETYSPSTEGEIEDERRKERAAMADYEFRAERSHQGDYYD
jgi:hypothetical protein|tara:strand:+ start:865 stop:1272 length:408 start_codon:yes stop_codon:yes gene_type:complete